MRKVTLGVSIVVMVVGAFLLGRVSAQDVEPSCEMCPATHVSAAELERYVAVGRDDRLTDQQVRSVDIGNSNVQIAVAHRGALDEPRPNSVASHDLVTEVYVVLSGSGTNRTSPDLVGRRRRPADNRAVQFLNGPGNNSADMRNPQTYELEAGDVFHHSGRDRASVHEDRRPHHLSDGADRPRQGGAADGRSRVGGLSG